MVDLPIRTAQMGDAEAIAGLIDRSVRILQAGDYTADQIDAALGSVFGVDRQLIQDQGYFVITDKDLIVGCGGWSRRRTLYGGEGSSVRDDQLLDPTVDAARIRAFFVDPVYARRGLGSRLLAACEAAAKAYGFGQVELGATLTGVPLYQHHGFVEVAREEAPLPDGTGLPIVRMVKRLA